MTDTAHTPATHAAHTDAANAHRAAANAAEAHATKPTKAKARAAAKAADAAHAATAATNTTGREAKAAHAADAIAAAATDVNEAIAAHKAAAHAHWLATQVRLHPDHSRYENRPGTTASGRSPYDNGDEAAETLRSLDLDGQYAHVALALATEPKAKTADEIEAELRTKYADKNLGMQRMNLGNKFRGFLNRNAKRAAAAK